VIEQEPKFRLRTPAPANLGGNGEQPLAESAKSDVRHGAKRDRISAKLQLTFDFRFWFWDFPGVRCAEFRSVRLRRF
jgi:hypothetical protein